MKKVILMMFAIMLLCLCGCSKAAQDTDEEVTLKLGKYVIEDYDKELPAPNLVLKENNEFVFHYSLLTSYLPIGHYEIKDNELILTLNDTSEKKEGYVFKLEEGKLIFQEAQSKELPDFAKEDVHDGVVFVLVENS